jgi:hypothetical protein
VEVLVQGHDEGIKFECHRLSITGKHAWLVWNTEQKSKKGGIEYSDFPVQQVPIQLIIIKMFKIKKEDVWQYLPRK